jgi:hypothetical protein
MVLLSALAVSATDAAAQEREEPGRVNVDLEVFDGDNGQPVRNVVVRLPALGTYLLTDSLGQTTFVDVPVGRHRMILTRMGYQAEAGEFTVDRAGSFRIALTPVLVRADAGPGEVRGRVIDPDTREGIAGVEVSVGGSIRRASDADGGFEMDSVPAGAHAFEAEYLGRQTLRDSIFVLEGELLEVEVPLPVEAIELEGITVTTQSKFLSDAGFYRRERAGTMYRGRQWTAEELAEESVLHDAIVELPAVMPAIPRAGEGTNMRYEAFRCRLAVYVDNFQMDPWFDLDHIDPVRVAAMEVYHGNTMPFRYAQHCGVILVWLKRR